jgi:phosphoribosylamine--glycine ligase
MKSEGIPFKGFLYAGVMIKDNEPYVLEYNVRMGDPECQPIIMRMDSDLYDYLFASTKGTLSTLPQIKWKKQSAVCIVLASKGYPEAYPNNEEISGLDFESEGTFFFHAGTKRENNKVFTNGGRVLGVTSLGNSLEDAISNAYFAADKVSWPNKYCRRDIGKKGLAYL